MANGDVFKFRFGVWVWIIVGYFSFHILYRMLIGGALGLDEAEIILHGRSFQLGYGAQLPLYAWLQRLVFLVTGPTFFGMVLLKNALLCGLVLILYFVLRTRLSAKASALAALSLILVPQFSWESSRALTHSVLVSFCAMACFAVVWRILRHPSLASFLLLGVALAAGGLSKYNFVIMPLSVMLACLCLPKARGMLYRPQLLLSLAVCGLLLAYPVSWVLDHPQIAFASVHKFEIPDQESARHLSIGGILAVLAATRDFLILPFIVLAALLILYRNRAQTLPRISDLEWLMWLTLAIAVAGLLIGVTVAGVTNMKDRWLQPALLLATPVATLWVLPRLTETGQRRLQQVYLALALLIIVALPFHYYKSGNYETARFDVLTPQIAEALPADTVILADKWVSGNLFYFGLARTQIVIPVTVEVPATSALALVWTGDDMIYARSLLRSALPNDTSAYLEAPKTFQSRVRFGDDQDRFTLSVARIVRDQSGGKGATLTVDEPKVAGIDEYSNGLAKDENRVLAIDRIGKQNQPTRD